jgi:hypothetical protein
MPEFEFNFNDFNVNPEPSAEPEEEFPNIDHLVPESAPEPAPEAPAEPQTASDVETVLAAVRKLSPGDKTKIACDKQTFRIVSPILVREGYSPVKQILGFITTV